MHHKVIYYKGKSLAYLEICKNALEHNFEVIKARCQDSNKVAIVLKDNAYGHGIDIVAPIAKNSGIKHAVVRDVKEAVFVQDLFETILVLNPSKIKLKPYMHQAINDLSQIAIIKEGSSVELKIDTGMHRNGVAIEDIDVALEQIKSHNLHLKGLFTHYKSSDMLTSEFFWQQNIFEQVKKKYSYLDVRFHSFNSAALFRANELNEDIARVGIAAYGYIDYEKGLEVPSLKPVMSLWANKIATKKVLKGQRIGYGGIYVAANDIIVSTYDAGYADGVFRINPQKPIPLANGGRTIGKVSMDSLSALSESDRIALFKDASIWAKHFNTISYEVLVSMKDSLQRVQV